MVSALPLICAGVGRPAELSWTIDEQMAERLVVEAYDHGADTGWFDYDPGMSHRFFVFDGLNLAGNGSFGFFAVNPWTGDVWALWGCHKLSTPALRKSQAEIRRRFAPQDTEEYDQLSGLKPDCVVED